MSAPEVSLRIILIAQTIVEIQVLPLIISLDSGITISALLWIDSVCLGLGWFVWVCPGLFGIELAWSVLD